MLNLYEITKENVALEELFLMAIDEETGEIADSDVLTQLEVELQNQLINKGSGIIKYVKNTELLLDSIDSEIKRLQTLKKTGESRLEKFQAYVINNMERLGTKKIETSLGNLVLRSSISTAIDETVVPKDERYFSTEVKTVEKFDKTKIKKLLQDGEMIFGAALVIKNNLNIK